MLGRIRLRYYYKFNDAVVSGLGQLSVDMTSNKPSEIQRVSTTMKILTMLLSVYGLSWRQIY